jgi:hypothetical protein
MSLDACCDAVCISAEGGRFLLNIREKTIYPTVSEDVKSVPVGRIAF